MSIQDVYGKNTPGGPVDQINEQGICGVSLKRAFLRTHFPPS